MSLISPENVHSTLSRYMLADGLDIVLDLEKCHGAILYDARHKREYLDLFGFFASLPVSFSHPKLKDSAYQEKLTRAAQVKPSNPDTYTVELAEFVDTFARLASRGHFAHHFFIEGGALGVENALKVAFDWKARKNLARGLPVGKQLVIHFREAFHGRSGYTLSLTNTFDPNKYQYFPRFEWPRILNPKLRFPQTKENLAETIKLEEEALRQIDRVIAEGPDDIACLIIEPIQAEGGDNHFRPEFFKELRKRADEHDFLLIFDEVQTGGGLCGTMWAFEQLEVRPDIISFGKKFQVAGCAATTRVDEVPDNVFKVSSRINSTFGGNLCDMVRSQRYLEIIEEERLLENTSRQGAFLLEGLSALSRRWSELTNVRGRGLFIAFDLPSSEERMRFRLKLKELGALCLPCGERSIRMRPVLDFSAENATRALELIEKALSACYGPRG